MEIKNAVAIVTGASSGIGRAIALEFAARGARLVLAARNAVALHAVAEEIQSKGGSAVVVPIDLTFPGAAETVVHEAMRVFRRIDILVNNAGIGLNARIGEAAADDVARLFTLNVLVPAAMIRGALPHMREQGAGMVINISSMAGRIAIPHIGYYSASKFALTTLGDALRMEEGHRGIRVMNVFPGMTRSNFSRNRLGQRGPAPHQRLNIAVPAEKVARRVARAVGREAKNVYISWFPDRLGAAGNWLAGWLVSAVLSRWARGAPE